MVDPVGTAIGVVGLFSTCLDCWHLIEDGRSMSKDFVIQRQRYLNLRLRFMLWGEACGLLENRSYSEDGFIPQSIRSNILETLGCIAILFEDGDKLRRRYGLDTDSALPALPATSNQTATSLMQAVTDQLSILEQRMKRVRSHVGRLGSFRWAISDKAKFTALIKHLGELVVDLETLTQSIGVRQKQRQLADREMQRITDISELQAIEEAGLNSNDLISDAASARISTLRNQLSDASHSPYHTAPSDRLGGELFVTVAPGLMPEISPETQWQRILASLRQREPPFQHSLLIVESESGDLLLRKKAGHLLSQLPRITRSTPQNFEDRRMVSAVVPLIDGPIGNDLREFIAAIEGPPGTINLPYSTRSENL